MIIPIPVPALFGPIGWPEILVLVLLGVLIFGRRLPDLGKSIGKGIVEFKKGLTGIEDDMNKAGETAPDHTNAQGDAPSLQIPDSTDSTDSMSKKT